MKQHVLLLKEINEIKLLQIHLYFQTFRIKPPMCITSEDVDFAMSVLSFAIEKEI